MIDLSIEKGDTVYYEYNLLFNGNLRTVGRGVSKVTKILFKKTEFTSIHFSNYKKFIEVQFSDTSGFIEDCFIKNYNNSIEVITFDPDYNDIVIKLENKKQILSAII